ncbi:MAG TPA: hypothetical protein PKD92_02095, partial [Novosphingobium sp.]|nr:hypothetical protein [Novosphingobium sp.]
MVTFTATAGTDNPALSAGDDIVNVTATANIQAADTFSGGDGIDTINVGAGNNTSVSVDLSGAGSNGVAGFLSFERLSFANSGGGNHSV